MSWHFRGRVDELATLETAWLAARDQEPPIMVVHGEAGIGKTRLVTELARSVRARGAETLWGTCYEGGSSLPYGVWVDALGPLLARLGSEGLQAALAADLRWLAPLLPDGALLEPAQPSVPAVVARARLAEVLVRILDTLPQRPLVILDDMQWAYPESLELFGHVARLATDPLIVVIFRGARLELGHPLAQRLAEASRGRACEYVTLGSLQRVEGGKLLEEAAGRPLGRPLLDALYDQSGGNAFFLGELGRYFHGHGDMTTTPVGDHPLPESIRGAVGLRVATLSAETRRMLQLASVFTAGFGFVELQAMTDLDDGLLLDCLEQVLAEEFVRPLGVEWYDFAHTLVRQTLYQQMSSSRRARLHRRLAEALERLYEQDPSPVAAELVRQYHASATLAGAERGATHAFAAAAAARAASAPGDAVIILRLGLDLVKPEDGASRARLLSELALAEAEAGLFNEAALTLETAVGLLEATESSEETIPHLVYRVGEAFWVAPSGADEIAPLIDRALVTLGERRNLAWARLKLVRRFFVRQVFGPISIIEWVGSDPEAVGIARDVGTEADYANTLNGWFPGFGAELQELIVRVDGWRDPGARMQALVGIVGYLTLLELGRLPAVTERLCSELGALADDVGLLPHRAVVRVFRAAPLGARGEFDAAADEIRQARVLFSGQIQARSSEALVTVFEALTVQHVEPDWPRTGDEMWELARTTDHFSGWLSLACAAFAAYAYACAGDDGRAREILSDILPALEDEDPLAVITSNAMGLAASAVWELRDARAADRLLPNAVILADADQRAFYMTSSDLTVARLSAVTGQLDQAMDYFERARVTLDRRGLPVLRAIVDHDEAVVRVEHHRPGANPLLDAARTQFSDLGMHEWSRRLATIDAPERELPDQLTAREAEILRLVAARRTNKEIAADLVLSVHTVERHVQNAYRKIGASSRPEASAYVTRVGL